jgi:hypothetical protein
MSGTVNLSGDYINNFVFTIEDDYYVLLRFYEPGNCSTPVPWTKKGDIESVLNTRDVEVLAKFPLQGDFLMPTD